MFTRLSGDRNGDRRLIISVIKPLKRCYVSL